MLFLIKAHRDHSIFPIRHQPEKVLIKVRSGLWIFQPLKRGVCTHHLLPMKNDWFVRMCPEILMLNLLHLRMNDSGNIPKFEDNTGKAQKPMIWII